MVGNPYYGAMGDVSTVFLCVCSPDYLQQLNASYEGCFLFAQVQDSSDVISEGRVRVVFSVPCEPQLDALIQNQHVSLESVRITHSPLYSVTESCFIYLTLYLWSKSSYCFYFQILPIFVFIQKYSVKYCPGYVLASRLGITSYLVSRFSGSIFIGRGSKKKSVEFRF